MRTPNSPLFKRSEILMALVFTLVFIALARFNVVL